MESHTPPPGSNVQERTRHEPTSGKVTGRQPSDEEAARGSSGENKNHGLAVNEEKKGGKRKKSRERGRKRKTSWGNKQLGGIYRFVNMVHRFRIYRLFKHAPPAFTTGCSHLMARLFFSNADKARKRVARSLRAFTRKDYSPRFVARFTDLVFKNMATILVDLMLNGPNVTWKEAGRILRFEGLDILDAALKKGKGVLMPSLHVGQFFHGVGGLLLHPNGYEVAGVANLQNQAIYEHMLQFPQYRNLHVIGSASFEKLRDDMLDHLSRNRIVFLMHDIARSSGLRTRMINGTRNVLVPTPQSIVSMHRRTGAPIVPLITIPDGIFTRSIVKILDPSPINAALAKAKDVDKKEYHGIASTAINKVLYPHALRYLHYWEELMTVGGKIIHEIRFDKGAPVAAIIEKTRAWFERYIEGSHEPGRDDLSLLKAWGETCDQMIDALEKHVKDTTGSMPALERRAVIKFDGLDTGEILTKLMGVIQALSRRFSVDKVASIASEGKGTLKRYLGP